MRKAFIAFCSVVVSACAMSPAPHPTAESNEQAILTTIPDSQMKEIKAEVAKQLKDPESARFGNINVGKFSNGDLILCGWINAKNSYGGYTGMKPFLANYVIQTKAVDMAIESSQYNIIPGMCRSRGMQVPTDP